MSHIRMLSNFTAGYEKHYKVVYCLSSAEKCRHLEEKQVKTMVKATIQGIGF